MTRPVREEQTPVRLVDGGGPPALQRLLEKVPEPREPAWARERIRTRLEAAARPRLSVLKLGAALALLGTVVTGLLLLTRHPAEPAPALATLVLASGEVSLASEGVPWQQAEAGAALARHGRVRTGGAGRALARFADADALFGERTVATLGVPSEGEGLAINLLQGSVTVSARKRPADRPLLVLAEAYTVRVVGTVFSVDVADDRAVEVRVEEGVVEVAGPQGGVRVAAGRSWSSRNGVGGASVPAGDVKLLAHMAGTASRTVPLRVEGPEGTAVTLDGVPLGTVPVQLLAPPGVGTLEGAGTRQPLALVEGQASRVVLLPPPDAPRREEVARAADVAPSPPAREERTQAHTPVRPPPAPRVQAPPSAPAPQPAPVADVVATLRARLQAATSAEEREALAYALARELVRRGGHAEAVELFMQVAAGSGPRAELGLYEVGRLRARFLHQREGAIAAFTASLQRFPGGTLEPEVLLSLAELHMQAGALSSAEPLLDAFLTRYASHARREEVRLLRGHVRRERGDCTGALADYAPLRAGTGVHAEAALYFSAVCTQRSGQLADARPLLEEYLRRFPQGPHRAEVERALGAGDAP